MTVTIKFSPQEALEVQHRAKEYGLPVEDYLRQLAQGQPLRTQSLQETLTPEEWIRVSHEWLDSLPANLPVLTDEEMSRESIYGEAH